MKAHKKTFFIVLWLLGQACALADSLNSPKPNKLLHMYEIFYLPFSIEFREGRTPNDIFPFLLDPNGSPPHAGGVSSLK